MQILLSTIGSRGDVQPLVGLGMQLKALGQQVRLCVPPDFKDWIEGLGLPVTPIGPALRPTAKAAADGSAATATPTPGQRRQMMDDMVSSQYATVTAAARDCDTIVAATGLQVATRSVAEKLGIRYVFAAFCPAVLPSRLHAPPVYGMRGQTPAPPGADNQALWDRDAAVFKEAFGPALNAVRTSVGLDPVEDVRSHIFAGQPWLAADPFLAPWPDPNDPGVFQTGAWILPDQRPLSPELENFLERGDAPIYFGFGSLRAPQGLSQVMIQSARALGRRAILARGWAELSLPDNQPDCLLIDEVNQLALFKRVAAVVQHGGAGTSTAAALSGAPQLILPQMFDQYYWAGRIQQLEIGYAHPVEPPTETTLTALLEKTLQPRVISHARAIAGKIRRDGALIAARRLIDGA